MIINNRKSGYLYTIVEKFNAGIVLNGNEVKSVRAGNATINDSYIIVDDKGEVWVKNMVISKYNRAHPSSKHNENRDKKLLLNRKEINRIEKLLAIKGNTCIILGVFNKDNKLKLSIAVVKGKRLWDKREDIKKKDMKRDMERNIKYK